VLCCWRRRLCRWSLLTIFPASKSSGSKSRLSQEPDYGPALIAKAVLLELRRGEAPGSAREFLDRAVAIDPSSVEAHFFRGQACWSLRSAPAASDAQGELLACARDGFEQARRLDPHFRLATNALAHTYLASRELAARGIEMLEEELRNGPHLQLAVTLMGLYARTGDREGAWRVHQEKIERWLDANAEQSSIGVAKAVEQSDLLVAEAWAEDGRCAAAGDLLRTAIEQSLHDTVKESFQARLEAFGDCAAAAGTAGL